MRTGQRGGSGDTSAEQNVEPDRASGDCLITGDFTSIDPGPVEHKYYKPGVGRILTVNRKTGAHSELVEIKGAPLTVTGITITDVFPYAGAERTSP